MFDVKVNGEDPGDLRIMRGRVGWKPTNAHHRHRLSWQQLAELVVYHGNEVRN